MAYVIKIILTSRMELEKGNLTYRFSKIHCGKMYCLLCWLSIHFFP